MKRLSLSKFALLTAVFTINAQANVLFTEYIEGSGNNKAIELTNLSTTAVDLSEFQVTLFSNGKTTATVSQRLSGMLAPGASYVIANAQAQSELKEKAQLLSAVTNFNGDDVLVLRQNDLTIDRFGQKGTDPGSAWGNSNISSKDRTLRRLEQVQQGDTDELADFDLSLQWQEFSKDDFAGLGCSGLTSCSDTGTPVVTLGECGDVATPLNQIQIAQDTSPFKGKTVEIEGVVTAALQGSDQMGGFYVQSLTGDRGLFIANAEYNVSPGQHVRLLGDVAEVYGNTQLNDIQGMRDCGEQVVQAADLTLPLDQSLELLEGQMVTLNQPLHVTLDYNFSRYGQIWLSSGKVFQPTDRYPANSSEAIDLAKFNKTNMLLVDDGSSKQNPELIRYFPQLSAEQPLRSGSQVNQVTGVIHYAYGQYQLIPTADIEFIDANPRAAQPTLTERGNLTLASFNVLNYFVNLATEKGSPYRGANSAIELERQRDKIFSALQAIDADVFGLMELENNGFGSDSAIHDLVSGLNNQLGANQYDYIRPIQDRAGADAITVGIIYKPSQVKPVGDVVLLTAYPFDEQTQKHRIPMIQTFEYLATGEQFTVAVNHFKSKGSSCDSLGDPDLGDGQGNCNGLRTDAAATLAQFINENIGGNAVLMGDFNAYSQEDPMLTFADYGFNTVTMAEDSYSYYYDGQAGSLDHGLVNEALAGKLVAATDWHINADEPRVLDYNVEYKSDAQLQRFYAPDAYRSSDHDPVVMSFALEPAKAKVEFAQSDLWLDESAGMIKIPVKQMGKLLGAKATVHFETHWGTAEGWSDYTSPYWGRLVWLPQSENGAKPEQQFIELTINDDQLVEGIENFTLNLVYSEGVALGKQQQLTVHIRDND
ncbi:ExeM/NucH family extracellular endonuclease [Motilimonas sp. E26]|uniref:ExeM/NucH family extracellular endonuclease n=1 Tax=Motilimonas sp. E26 TaxID=2865674 RepID=UPI001E43F5A8|nr:ExeM/NucH family extracellular endonuclease [Motilimonas sp. E26]MCE0555423.1 ExeM/NucH family extracellular endonuclease [Motilimonas sp. E26]